MNLPLRWCDFFAERGLESCHWSAVGDPCATDTELMAWAQAHGYIVFTHDLDFGDILAATQAKGPSVIQVRAQNILPEIIGDQVVQIIARFHEELTRGTLISLDPQRARARILPLGR